MAKNNEKKSKKKIIIIKQKKKIAKKKTQEKKIRLKIMELVLLRYPMGSSIPCIVYRGLKSHGTTGHDEYVNDY